MEVIARKAGIKGMVGGQAVDVELTGKALSDEQLDFIFRLFKFKLSELFPGWRLRRPGTEGAFLRGSLLPVKKLIKETDILYCSANYNFNIQH